MSKKLFGILCNYVEDSSSDKLSINKDYIEYFETYGNTTLVNPMADEVKEVDCLVLIGGSDINPYLYGDCYDLHTSQPNRALERFDHVMLPQYLAAGIKMFGICRGFQRLGIGITEITGSLNKHVEDEQTSSWIGHAAHFAGDFDKRNCFFVNSHHHQSIKELGQDLIPLLWAYEAEEVSKNKYAPGDRRAIEAFVHKDNLYAGVQWHPERGYDSKSLQKAEEFTRNLITDILA